MQANILGFEDKLPETLYWDPSFVLNFSIEGATYYQECKEFSRRLRKERVTSIISNLGLDEIWYGLLRAKLISDFPEDWLNKLREEKEVINKHMKTLREATRDLTLLPNLLFVEIKTETTFEALDAMEKYHLLPRDAIHLATMQSLGVKNIVTTDMDFTRVPNINVYTCNPKILQNQNQEKD